MPVYSVSQTKKIVDGEVSDLETEFAEVTDITIDGND